MNDFTKEELEELYFFTCVHKNRYQVKYPQELLDKLQCMIDNYCEHEAAGETEIFADICKTCYSLLLRQKHY